MENLLARKDRKAFNSAKKYLESSGGAVEESPEIEEEGVLYEKWMMPDGSFVSLHYDGEFDVTGNWESIDEVCDIMGSRFPELCVQAKLYLES